MHKTIGMIIILILLAGCSGKTYEQISVKEINENPRLAEGKNLVFITKLITPTDETTPWKVTSHYDGRKVLEYKNTPGAEYEQDVYYIIEGNDTLLVQGYDLYWEIYPAEITQRHDNIGVPEHLKKKFYEDTIFEVKGTIALLPACTCKYKEHQKIDFELDEFPEWMEQNHAGDEHWGYDDTDVEAEGLVSECDRIKELVDPEAACGDRYDMPVLNFEDAEIVSSTDSWNLDIIRKYKGKDGHYSRFSFWDIFK